MTPLRILAIAAVLLAAFLFGVSLTSNEFPFKSAGFPVNRKFIAVSLNSEPFNYERMVHLPTLEVRRNGILRLRAFGHGGCNAWSGDVAFPSGQSIVWKNPNATVADCSARTTERAYLSALLSATRWRTEDRTLILEHGNDILRFKLAPS